MTEPLRVLHVVGSLAIGGIQSYLMELYRHIDRSKVQFDFVVHIKTEQSYAEEVKALGGKVFYIDGDAFEKKAWGKYIRFWKGFYSEHTEYHVVHGHLRSTSTIYLKAAKKAGCYTIAHSHATSNGYGKSGKVKDILQYPTRYIADFCMGCSQQANEWMFGKKRANGDSCIVLHNGIDVEKFRFSQEKRIQKRAELGLSDEEYVIGCVGRLVEQKNQGIVISAMPTVLEAMPSTVLILVGEGPMRDKIKQQIEDLEIDVTRIRMLGSRTDVNELLNAFDLFVLPSKDEGLGIAAIEAQANGLPVLVSEAVPEEVFLTRQVERVGENGIDWAYKICSFNRKRASETVRDIDKAGYNIKLVASQLLDIYLAHQKD